MTNVPNAGSNSNEIRYIREIFSIQTPTSIRLNTSSTLSIDIVFNQENYLKYRNNDVNEQDLFTTLNDSPDFSNIFSQEDNTNNVDEQNNNVGTENIILRTTKIISDNKLLFSTNFTNIQIVIMFLVKIVKLI